MKKKAKPGITDHGYGINENMRCAARTKKEQQCQLPAIAGIILCALHSGLARARRNPEFGDPRALEAFKRAHARTKAA